MTSGREHPNRPSKPIIDRGSFAAANVGRGHSTVIMQHTVRAVRIVAFRWKIVRIRFEVFGSKKRVFKGV